MRQIPAGRSGRRWPSCPGAAGRAQSALLLWWPTGAHEVLAARASSTGTRAGRPERVGSKGMRGSGGGATCISTLAAAHAGIAGATPCVREADLPVRAPGPRFAGQGQCIASFGRAFDMFCVRCGSAGARLAARGRCCGVLGQCLSAAGGGPCRVRASGAAPATCRSRHAGWHGWGSVCGRLRSRGARAAVRRYSFCHGFLWCWRKVRQCGSFYGHEPARGMGPETDAGLCRAQGQAVLTGCVGTSRCRQPRGSCERAEALCTTAEGLRGCGRCV